MLTKETEYFIEVLSDFIQEKKSTINSNVNMQAILEMAHKQQVESIFFYQLKDFFTDDKLTKAYSLNCYYYTNRIFMLNKIHTAFKNNGIKYLIFKGTEISQYYPVPSLRSMGDSDILVAIEDKESAHKALIDLGFEKFGLDNSEWHYKNRGIEIELHHRMLFDEKVNLENHKKFTDTAWDYAHTDDGTKYHLDMNFHLIYLILHLRKHFINSGVGFRQFMDLAIVVKNNEIDVEWIKSKLESLELLEFAKKCFYFCEKWFGICVPFKAENISDEFYERSTLKILNDGVFGFANSVNHDNAQIYKMIVSKNPKIYKLKYMCDKVFPPYSVMIESKKYSFIKNAPVLLPVAWIYRFFICIFRVSAVADFKEKSSPVNVSKKDIDKRNKSLSEWGL